MQRKFGIRDAVFLAVLFLSGIILTIGIYHYSNVGQFIRITRDGTVIGTYALEEDQLIPIEENSATINVICISDGRAYMKEASCPDGLCIRQGAIEKEGQAIVCLPHKLVVEVYGEDEQEYDAVSR